MLLMARFFYTQLFETGYPVLKHVLLLELDRSNEAFHLGYTFDQGAIAPPEA